MTINSVVAPIPFTISMCINEQDCFKTVDSSVRELYHYLENHRATRMVCTDTAELIEVDELRRVCDILNGLIRRCNWEGRVE